MAGPDDDDDLFGEDPEFEKFAQEHDRREDRLHDLVEDLMEEEGIDEAYTAQLLVSLALKMRMVAYATAVEQPSVAGLKRDLDRMHQELGEFVREAKKGAVDYIELVKRARAEAEREAEEGEEE